MRTPKPENKQIYVRFHVRAMDIIKVVAQQKQMKPATVVRLIIEEYMYNLYQVCRGNINDVTEAMLDLSPISSAYFIRRGRATKSIIASPMIITMNRKIERDMEIISVGQEMTIQDFRTAIIITYGSKYDLIQGGSH